MRPGCIVAALLALSTAARADQGWQDNQDGQGFVCTNVGYFQANNLAGAGNRCARVDSTGKLIPASFDCVDPSAIVTSVTGTAQRVSASPTVGAVVVDTIGGYYSGAASGGNQNLGALSGGEVLLSVSGGVASMSTVPPYTVLVDGSDATAGYLSTKLMATAPIGLTIAGSGAEAYDVSLDANGVDNTYLAQMPAGTIKGNMMGATANAADLTTAQVTAMLNPFTSSLQGLAPASGGSATTYLDGSGAWSVPSGTSPGSAITGLTFPLVSGVPTLTESGAVHISSLNTETIGPGVDGYTSIGGAVVFLGNGVVSALSADTTTGDTSICTTAGDLSLGRSGGGSVKLGPLAGATDALAYGTAADGTLGRVTLGTGLTFTGGTLSASGTSPYYQTIYDDALSPLPQEPGLQIGGGISVNDDPGDGVTEISVPTFLGSSQGLVPGSAGGTTNFLRADGAWSVPSGTSPGSAITGLTFPLVSGVPTLTESGAVHISSLNTETIGPGVDGYTSIGGAVVFLGNGVVSALSADTTTGDTSICTTAGDLSLGRSGGGSVKLGPLAGATDALAYGTAADGTLGRVTLGTGLTFTGGTLSASGTSPYYQTIYDDALSPLPQEPGLQIGGGISVNDDPGDGVTEISVPTFLGSSQGLVPGSAGGTTNFLRADGAWSVPSGTSPGSAITGLTFPLVSGVPTLTESGAVHISSLNTETIGPGVDGYTSIGGAVVFLGNGVVSALSADTTTGDTSICTTAGDLSLGRSGGGSVKLGPLAGATDALAYGTAADGTLGRVTLGTGLTFTGGTLSASGGGGTAPGSAITGLTFPLVSGVPTLTESGAVHISSLNTETIGPGVDGYTSIGGAVVFLGNGVVTSLSTNTTTGEVDIPTALGAAGIVKASGSGVGKLGIASSADITNAISWPTGFVKGVGTGIAVATLPTAGEIMASSGPTTDPVGDAYVQLDTTSHAIKLPLLSGPSLIGVNGSSEIETYNVTKRDYYFADALNNTHVVARYASTASGDLLINGLDGEAPNDFLAGHIYLKLYLAESTGVATTMDCWATRNGTAITGTDFTFTPGTTSVGLLPPLGPVATGSGAASDIYGFKCLYNGTYSGGPFGALVAFAAQIVLTP